MTSLQVSESKRLKIAQPLSPSSTTTTTHTPTNVQHPNTHHVSDFHTYIPLDIRLEIYSTVDPEIETRLKVSYTSLSMIQAKSRYEQKIFTAALMNDKEALHFVLLSPTCTNSTYQQLKWCESVSAIVARCGSLSTLQWFGKEHNMDAIVDAICESAAYGGHRPILQWIQQQGYVQEFSQPRISTNAAYGGRFQLLKWLREQGCNWDERTCEGAASGGHLEILRYLHEHGCPWNAGTCEMAAERDDLEMLRYAHEQGCPWDEWTCRWAANNGYLEILRYAHQRGCPWDEEICLEAAWNGHLEIIRYAHKHGYCPWDSRLIQDAMENGHKHILRWARKHGYPEFDVRRGRR